MLNLCLNFLIVDLVCKNYKDLWLEILFFIKQCPLKFMSGNIWWSTKYGEKLLSGLVIFSILSYEIPLDFHHSIQVEQLRYLKYF